MNVVLPLPPSHAFGWWLLGPSREECLAVNYSSMDCKDTRTAFPLSGSGHVTLAWDKRGSGIFRPLRWTYDPSVVALWIERGTGGDVLG